MKGRELLLRAIRNETTPRPAWLPFVGAHGARIIGQKASAYLQSADLVVQGLKKARELYRPDGLPVMFDLQMEAEALGCELRWSDQGPPSVAAHPLESGKSLPDLPVFDPSQGRFPVALDALRTLKKDIGSDVALYGLICGPFTLALHLLGNSIFMQMFDHPDYVKAVVGFCASVGRKAAQAYLENGADVIAVVDPMTSQISAAHFQEFCTSPLNDLFNFIRERKGCSSLFVCGDASRNLEAMGATTCDNMSIDENIPLENVRDITRACNKSFGGNLKLTSVLLLGNEDDAKLDAIRCIDIGGGCGYILSPGCDLPFNVPERNLAAVAAMVHDRYEREVAKRTIIARSAAEADAVYSIPGGSIFCRCLVTEFIDALQTLPERFNAAAAPIEGVVIEASGMADPRVIRTLLQETRLDRLYRLGSIVAIVEPQSFLKLIHTLPAILAQVEAADRVLVNKTDLASPEEIAATEQAVREASSRARIVRTCRCAVDVDLFGRAPKRELHGELAPCVDPDYARLTLRFSGDTDVDDLRRRIVALSDDIYRAKGFVPAGGRLLSFDYSAAGLGGNTPPTGAAEPALVFIVKGPSRPRVARALSGLKNAALET